MFAVTQLAVLNGSVTTLEIVFSVTESRNDFALGRTHKFTHNVVTAVCHVKTKWNILSAAILLLIWKPI
jgi:hypothetical protein